MGSWANRLDLRVKAIMADGLAICHYSYFDTESVRLTELKSSVLTCLLKGNLLEWKGKMDLLRTAGVCSGEESHKTEDLKSYCMKGCIKQAL